VEGDADPAAVGHNPEVLDQGAEKEDGHDVAQREEEKPDLRVFFRANRSQIINLKAVDSIHPWFGGRLMARIHAGAEVVLSRRKSKEFRERMSV